MPSSPPAAVPSTPPSSKSPSDNSNPSESPTSAAFPLPKPSPPATGATALPMANHPATPSQSPQAHPDDQTFFYTRSLRNEDNPSLKRHFEFSLPSDNFPPPHPSKRVKKVLTTVSAERGKEVEDLHALHMLQLARASREAFAANARYRLKRIHELDVMRTIAYDEYEEAATLVKNADSQIGELRHFLVTNETSIVTLSSLKLSPIPANHSGTEVSHEDASRDHTPSSATSPFEG